MLTHLHSDHTTGVVRLLNLMNVNTVILPDNAEDTNGDNVLDDIIAACEENGTNYVIRLKENQILREKASFLADALTSRTQNNKVDYAVVYRRCDTPLGLRKL